MQTQTFYRKANVTTAEAIASVDRAFPGAKLVDFQQKKAEDKGEAVAARAQVGDDIFVVSIQKKAEFPPKEDSGDSEAPESDPGSEAPGSDSDDEGADSEEAPSPFDSEDSGEEEPKEEKLSPEEETVHLLRQILDAVKGGGGLGPDEGPGDPLGLPDIGAPEGGPGGALPPVGGPKPPLPPPIKEKKPVGGPAFASFKADADEQILIRHDVEDTLTVAAIKQEAEEFWPTHRVAAIRWAGSRDDKQAVVKLVKR